MTRLIIFICLICWIRLAFGGSGGIHSKLRFSLKDPISTFFGRSDFLQLLHASLQQDPDTFDPIKIIIQGREGVGKTETLRKYIQTYSSSYDKIVWLNGENQMLLRNSFLTLTTPSWLHLPLSPSSLSSFKSGQEKTIKEIVQEIYLDIGRQGNNLFILDNVEDYNIIQDFLPLSLPPPLKAPSMIFLTRHTSRNNITNLLSQSHLLPLMEFTEEESMEFFLNQLDLDDSVKNKREGKKLGRSLRNLPLALQLSAAYIKQENQDHLMFTLQNYTELLQKETENFLDATHTRGNPILPHPLLIVCQLTLDKISRKSSLAHQTVQYMSLLNSGQTTPVKLLYDILLQQGIPHENVTESLLLLEKYSILRLSDDFQNLEMEPYEIHSQIQNFTLSKGKIFPPTIKALVETLDKLLAITSLPPLTEQMYLNGIESAVLKLVSTNLDLIKLKLKFALRLQLKENYESYRGWIIIKQIFLLINQTAELSLNHNAVEIVAATLISPIPGQILGNETNEIILGFHKRIHQLADAAFSPRHPFTLKMFGNLGKILTSQGRYDEAYKLYEELLKIQRESFSSSSGRVEIGVTLQLMGSARINQNRNEDALLLFGEAYDMEKMLHGESHPESLIHLQNMATVLAKNGDTKNALQLYEFAQKLQQKNSGGAETAVSFSTQYNIATLKLELGEYEEALQLFKKVYEGRTKLLGPNDPEALLSLRQIGSVHFAQEKYEDAHKIFNQVWETQSKFLGPSHPETVVSRLDIADVLSRQGKAEEAQEIYLQVLQGRQNIFGGDHSETLKTLEKVADFQLSHSNVDEGVRNYEKIYNIRKVKLGEEHEETVSALSGLASGLSLQGKDEEALLLFKKVYSILKKKKGSSNTQTLSSVNRIALLYSKKGDHQNALRLLKTIHKIQQEILGEKDPLVLSTLLRMGHVRMEQNSLTQALKIYDEALALSRKIYGATDHSQTISILKKIANIYYNQEEGEKFLAIQNEILDIQKRTFGQEHQDTLTTMGEMSRVHMITENYDAALELTRKVYDTQKKNLDPGHPKLIEAIEELTEMLRYKDDTSEGTLDLLKQIYEHKKKEKGPDHEETLKALQNISDVYYIRKEFGKAVKLMMEIHDSRKSTLGKGHPDTITPLLKIVGVYKLQNDLEKALDLYIDIYERRKENLGMEHEDTQQMFFKMVQLMDSMALEYYSKNEYTKALGMYENAWEIRSSILGKDHPEALANLEGIALSLYDLGKYKQALEKLGQMLKSQKKTLGVGHPSTKSTMEFIQAIEAQVEEDGLDEFDEDERDLYNRDEL